MFKTGLVSITFRNLQAREVVELVVKSRLDAIEWGGDVHVPHGDRRRAAEVAAMTTGEGLECCSYGSYYRCGESEAEGLAFASVLDSAAEIAAPVVRVWAGRKGSAAADAEYWRRVADDAERVAALAAERGIKVAFEFHGGTLTDTNASAVELLKLCPSTSGYWQPAVAMNIGERLDGLRQLLPRLSYIHAFHWRLDDNGKVERLALADGAAEWRQYLDAANSAAGDRHALIEFVRGDSPEQFLADAEFLRYLVANRLRP